MLVQVIPQRSDHFASVDNEPIQLIHNSDSMNLRSIQTSRVSLID